MNGKYSNLTNAQLSLVLAVEAKTAENGVYNDSTTISLAKRFLEYLRTGE